MRNHSPKRRSDRGPLGRLFHRPAGRSGQVSRAPRRREVERLEERQMLTTVGTPTNEPLFGNQWHLEATGQNIEFDAGSPTFGQQLASADINVVPAWEYGFSGSGIQIVIADTGFDLTHEDLVFLPGIDLLDLDVDPSFVDATDASGTAIAGVIGARDNGVGTVGVAYQSDLIPLRLNPGAFDANQPTIDAINAAFREGAGLIVDLTGDGVPDRVVDGTIVPLTLVDIDGDGTPEGLGQDPSLVTDVFYHSGDFIDDTLGEQSSRVAANLPTGPSTLIPGAPEISILTAVEQTAIGGRAVWVDANNDGLVDPEEIEALGAIHVVPAGNDAGFDQTQDGSAPTGTYSSSQYNELANSPFTLTIGGVDFGADFENNATGTITSIFEGGANVLVVAPTGVLGTDIGSTSGLDAGILTTDPTGDFGANLAGLPNFEFDGDFFADTNYSSRASGSEFAAAQVAGVVSLVLEANPLLSRRDVEQILLQSAVTNDQFNESWIVNQMQRFQDPLDFLVVPQYARYDLDTNADGDPDFEDVIIPNTNDPDLFFGYFLNEATVALPVPFIAGSPGFVDTTGIQTGETDDDPPLPTFLEVLSGPNVFPSPIEIFADGTFDDATGGLTFLNSPLNTNAFDLVFENGAGFTVSQGYGNNLEEFGYAHGLVDAEKAVELALAWDANDLYLDDQIILTTDVPGGPNTTFSIQPRAFVLDADGDAVLEIPGGGGTEAIGTAVYQEFFSEIEAEDVEDVDGNVIGEVITSAPFSEPEDLDLLNTGGQGGTLLPLSLSFDSSVDTDFLNVEWITLTTTIETGDVDHLRFALLSPDGTQTEFNGFRNPVSGTELDAAPAQSAQGAQGRVRPSQEAIDRTIGTPLLDDGQTIEGSEVIDILEVNTDPNQLPNSESWTWTTNRHRGEIFSTQANSPDGGSLSDGWFLIIENHGDGFIEIGSQIEISLLGTAATGNRIQGKVGIDDNAQGVDGLDTDENFNFNRFVEFAELTIVANAGLPDPISYTQTIVLDDPNDSVYYSNTQASPASDPELTGAELDQVYRTVDPATGLDIFYPVVNRDDYFGINPTALQAAAQSFIQLVGDPITGSTATQITDVVYRTQTNFTPGEPGDDSVLPGSFAISTPLSYRNFDYSQETFASGVTVVATQFEVVYDAAGNASAPVATGVTQKFTTGADGNYYFDVLANPAPPLPGTPDYDAWFTDFGKTFEYEIAIEGEGVALNAGGDAEVVAIDPARILTNNDEGDIGYADVPATGAVNFDPAARSYTVQIDADDDFQLGNTAKTTNVNFLLTVDPAETNVEATGTVFRDRNGDGVISGFEERLAGVTVFFDQDNDGTPEASGVTDANGEYNFTISGLTNPQDVTISVDLSTVDPSFTPFSPVSGELTVSATPGTPVTGVNFAFQLTAGEPAQVSGVVFDDRDADGVFDGNEIGLDASRSLRVFIDTSGDGAFQAGEPSAVTADDGTFNIESSVTGAFQVRIDPASTGLTQTTPTGGAGIPVTVAAGQTSSGLLFGVFDNRTQDFGDLFVDALTGVNYPTRLADDGARHLVVSDVFLGAGVDAESDGAASTDASGDDALDSDDEDGVVLLTPITNVDDPSTGALDEAILQFDITATGVGASLNVWIDFNDDGDWDDAGEHVFVNVSGLSPDGVTTTTRLSYDLLEQGFAIDFDPTAASFAARFRWGPFGVGYTGAANAGEVEDYRLPAVTPIGMGGVDGDFDGDGDVDDDDFGVFAGNFGSTGLPPNTPGDFDGDGDVDDDDFGVFAGNFGTTAAVSTAQVAPLIVIEDYDGDGDVDDDDFGVFAGNYSSLTVDAFAPMSTPTVAFLSTVDDALAVGSPAVGESGGDAVDAALLQLDLDGPIATDADTSVEGPRSVDDEDEDSLELALADEAFVF